MTTTQAARTFTPTEPRPVLGSTVTVETMSGELVTGRVFHIEVWGGWVAPRWVAGVGAATGRRAVGTVVPEESA